MELFLTILGGVLGIIGAFAGAWIANRYERRQRIVQDRKDTTFALYEEYQSPSMMTARIEARNILSENNDATDPLSLSELRKKLSVEQWSQIATVMTFFEKLGILLQNDYLDSELSKSLLAYDFRYWHEKHLSDLIVRGDQSQSQWWKSIQFVAGQWL